MCDKAHSDCWSSTGKAYILDATAIAFGAGTLLSVSNFKNVGNGIFASAKENSAIARPTSYALSNNKSAVS